MIVLSVTIVRARGLLCHFSVVVSIIMVSCSVVSDRWCCDRGQNKTYNASIMMSLLSQTNIEHSHEHPSLWFKRYIAKEAWLVLEKSIS